MTAGAASRATLAALADADCAIAAAPVTDTVKEAASRPARRRHARPLAPVGGPDAAGLPARGARGARWPSTTTMLARATDDAWLVERAGGTVRVVESSPANFKVTTPHDLRVAERPARVLTDYHVHLRPDDVPSSSAEHYFTAANAERYRETATERGDRRARRLRAHLPLQRRARRLAAPVLARRARSTTSTPTAASCARRPTCGSGSRPTSSPGREDRMANLLDGRDWDYVVGSVHFLGDLARRHRRRVPIWGAGESRRDRSGGATSRRSPSRPAAGLFDIIAHPDLVKIWGRRGADPGRRPAPLLRARGRGDADAGVAIEVSTAGLRKPVGEHLPGARRSSRWRVDAGCPIALSSDAHAPEHLGFELRATRSSCCSDCGVREIAVFERRERRLEPLG